jgi:Domain of unknown function (DUF4389)
MYPVSFAADYVEPRSRLTTFFRLILAIPHIVVLYLFAIAALLGVVVAWFAILFTAHYPPGLYGFVSRYVRYATQVMAYITLLTDEYPQFGGADDYPVRMTFAGPLPEYSRLKTFFRGILAIPLVVLRYVAGILIELGALGAWFVIVITGKMPPGLQDVMVLASSFTARSDAYLFLLTETYPPFREDMAAVTTGTTAAPSETS